MKFVGGEYKIIPKPAPTFGIFGIGGAGFE